MWSIICSAVWRSPLCAQWNSNSLAPNPYEDYRVLPTLPHFQNSSQSQCHHNQFSNMDTDTRKIKSIPKGTQSHIAKLESTPVTVSRVFVFCSVYYSQPIPHPLESLQLCLYPSGVFLPLSVMCFASLRCGHVFNYYPPETPVSFKETTPCHCLKWILLEAVLHSDSHLAHSVCIIQITLPICPWFARWHNSSECMLGFIQGLLLS